MQGASSESHNLGSEQTLLTCAVEVPVQYSGGSRGQQGLYGGSVCLSLQRGGSEDGDRRGGDWERIPESIHPSNTGSARPCDKLWEAKS